MRTFDFSTEEPFPFKQTEFILLGAETGLIEEEQLWRKLHHEETGTISGVWGTLGWADDRPFRLSGKLHFSRDGNLDEAPENPVTQQEIEGLKAINELLKGRERVIRERFINFDQVEFTLPPEFSEEEIPRLRLSLFVAENEGAIVYYQHSEKGRYNDRDAFVEYILCEKTDAQYSTARDRLHYFFPLIPASQLEPVPGQENRFRLSDKDSDESFILKILTFKRTPAVAAKAFTQNVKTLSETSLEQESPGTVFHQVFGKKKYDLMKFDPSVEVPFKDEAEHLMLGGKFDSVSAGNPIDTSKRTLLLIHGTFVNTLKSFKHLWLKNGHEFSILQRLIHDGYYEQILAFDHPTISEDAHHNVKVLLQKMQTYRFSGNPIDVITTSRGSLVAAALSSLPEARDIIPLRKVLMFSAGNGCGYFTTGTQLARGLSILRQVTPGPATKIVLALAQYSAEFFLSRPGSIMMTIDHRKKVLEKMLDATPNDPATLYKCVVSDWDKKLIARDGWLKKLGKSSLDLLIRIPLGREHDWVIGAQRQDISPAHSPREASDYRLAIHGRYLEAGYVLDRQFRLIDPHEVIFRFFEDRKPEAIV